MTLEPVVEAPATDEPEVETAEQDDARKLPAWAEFLVLVLVSLLVVILSKAFFLQFFSIPTGSMERTLMCGDRVVVNRLAYAGAGPSRRDVIVFEPEWSSDGETVPTPSTWAWLVSSLRQGVPFLDRGRAPDLIKRVIALPGETVQVERSHASVDGKRLDEPYVFLNGPDSYADFGPVRVPPGQVFVLGDHRNSSNDSRAVPGGRFVDVDVIVGRAFARAWPPGHWGGLRGPPASARDEPLCA